MDREQQITDDRRPMTVDRFGYLTRKRMEGIRESLVWYLEARRQPSDLASGSEPASDHERSESASVLAPPRRASSTS
jgi:hypothetical protein